MAMFGNLPVRNNGNQLTDEEYAAMLQSNPQALAAMADDGAPSVSSAAPGGIFGKLGGAGSGQPGFFDKGGLGSKIANTLGQAAFAYSAQKGNPIALMKLRQLAADRDASRDQIAWQQRHDIQRADALTDRDYEAKQPRYFSGGQDQVRYDPTSGRAQTIYDAPTPAESYAGNFGARGSNEYRQAMSDYVLRGWGDTALDNRLQMEGVRFGNRRGLKQTPTYANLHPRASAPRQPTVNGVIAGLLQKQNAGQPLAPGEQQTLADYRSRTGGGGRSRSGAPSATAPVKVSTPDEARRLPPGTMFQTPDGRIKVAG